MALTYKKNRALKRILRNKLLSTAYSESAAKKPETNTEQNEPAYSLSAEIPNSYNDTYVRAIPRDPRDTFVYWEVPKEQAASSGIPNRGNVHTFGDKAAWITERVNAAPKPIPETIPPAFETQTRQHESTQQQTPARARETTQPTQGSRPSTREQTQTPQYTPLPIPPTRPSEFETQTPSTYAPYSAPTESTRATPESMPSMPSAQSAFINADPASITPASTAQKQKQTCDITLEFLIRQATEHGQTASANPSPAMSSGIFHNTSSTSVIGNTKPRALEVTA